MKTLERNQLLLLAILCIHLSCGKDDGEEKVTPLQLGSATNVSLIDAGNWADASDFIVSFLKPSNVSLIEAFNRRNVYGEVDP